MSDDLLNKLTERDRRERKVSRMIPATGKLTDEQRRETIANVRTYCRRCNISQKKLADGVGTNGAYVSFLMAGKFGEIPRDTVDDLVRAVNNFIEFHAQSSEQNMPSTFHQTKVAKRLFGVAKNTKVLGCMSAAHGPAGIGKTLCSKAVCREIPGTIYVCINQGCKLPSHLLRQIYDATYERGSRRDTKVVFETVVNRLRGSGRLLIVDQAHRLTERCRETVMDLHDAAELPVLLLGTIKTLDQVSSDHDAYFGQLASRVAIRKNLLPEISKPDRSGQPRRWLTPDEIRAIFYREALKIHPDAARMLAAIANSEVGHLRRAGWLFDWAAQLAAIDQGCQGTVLVRHLTLALRQVDDSDTDQAAAALDAYAREMRQAAASAG